LSANEIDDLATVTTDDRDERCTVCDGPELLVSLPRGHQPLHLVEVRRKVNSSIEDGNLSKTGLAFVEM
jgi:hypothetical protein